MTKNLIVFSHYLKIIVIDLEMTKKTSESYCSENI